MKPLKRMIDQRSICQKERNSCVIEIILENM